MDIAKYDPITMHQYRGIGGMFARIRLHDKKRASLTITDGNNTTLCKKAVHINNGEEVPGIASTLPKTQPFVFYKGNMVHPAGNNSPVSWVNDCGIGLIRIVNPGKQILVFPLIGLQKSPHEPIAPRAGKRGPSRSSDLWLIATAWKYQGFTLNDLSHNTGLSLVTVDKWFRDMENHGYIAHNPHTRHKSYALRQSVRDVLANHLVDRWLEWRRGKGTPSLRPNYWYFDSYYEWKNIKDLLRNKNITCFPSGVTALENGGKLARGGLLPALQLYTDYSSKLVFTNLTHIKLRRDKKRDDDSTLCVLKDDHPLFRLGSRTLFPLGFAALDALDNQDHHISQCAREVWQEWLEGSSGDARIPHHG